jgi:NAD(P)-dependent dehydrogenase (short-subunit alcohol dehydrogenase family)
MTDMHGKTCLITGATSGIGRVTAGELARRGAHVVLVGRSQARLDSTLQEIQAQTGGSQVEAILADLSSQRQVRELASRLRERHPRLDVLINNAGGIWMQRQVSEDGLEMTFAVNHLAYFLLTNLLLDVLRTSAPARVVNVSSEAHRRATLDFDDLQGERRYSGWRQYCRSKLMNLLFSYELARQLAGTGVTVNALHPGWVATGFAGHNGWRGWLIQSLAKLLALSPEQGAQTVIYLAAAPEVAEVSRGYFIQQRQVASSPASYDEAAASRLWEKSLELTNPSPARRSVSPG